MITRLTSVGVLLALALAACSTTSDTGAKNDGGNDGGSGCEVATVTGATGAKPKVELTTGCEASKELVKKDLIAGTGPEAKAGSSITVHYVGMGLQTRQEFDASWNRGDPFTLVLGSGGVIRGWDEGLVGVKAGGRRLLVIPAEFGYGAQGRPPAILGGETLVFVVDVVAVK